jgi:ABC-2 type transport system ATP-binding protein
MSAADVVLQTESLTKTFGGRWGRPEVHALSDLSLTIHQGEVFGLLGPNGSGKTTTVKLCLGLLFPTKGTISLFGRKPQRMDVKRRVGFLPEETYLYRFLTGREILHFYGKLFSIPRAERTRRADELLEQFGMTHAADRPLKEYSKGMARRIGFAQALVNDPDLVFLDEPTSGLDPIGMREIKDLILHLKEQGKTIFINSHLLGDVQEVCDHIAILHKGVCQTQGPVADLLEVQDRQQLVVRGISPESLAELQGWFAEHGATLESSGVVKETLESLFLKTVDRAEGDS